MRLKMRLKMRCKVGMESLELFYAMWVGMFVECDEVDFCDVWIDVFWKV